MKVHKGAERSLCKKRKILNLKFKSLLSRCDDYNKNRKSLATERRVFAATERSERFSQSRRGMVAERVPER